MVRSLITEGILHSDRVIEALRKVPRELFVPEKLQAEAYIDAPLPTGHGQTISVAQAVIISRRKIERGRMRGGE